MLWKKMLRDIRANFAQFFSIFLLSAVAMWGIFLDYPFIAYFGICCCACPVIDIVYPRKCKELRTS